MNAREEISAKTEAYQKDAEEEITKDEAIAEEIRD